VSDSEDSHYDRCFTVGQLRAALEEYPDDRPLTIDHNEPEFENVIVDDDDDSVVLY